MTENYFFYGLVSASVVVTLAYLNKATGRQIVPGAQGKYLLRLHKLYYIVGLISVAVGGIFLVAPLIINEPNVGMYIMVFLVILFFGGLGLLSILYYKNHYVLFDTNKIEVRNVFGKIKIFYWNEIKEASYNPHSSLLTLINESGQKVKIHQHLVGLSKFIDYLEEKTCWTAKQLKLPVKRN